MTREQILALPKPLRIAVQLVTPTGQHRPQRPELAVADTKFVQCKPCGVESAATVHDGVTLCAEGHEQPRGAA